MPLYSKNKIDSSTTLLLWKIEEDYDTLFSSVKLQPDSIKRLEKFSSTKRKIEFLATRKLLEEVGLSDADLSYRNDGAPLIKGKFISISHTSDFVAIIVSNKRVGIDIERNRQQILRIAHKFVNEEEKNKFDVDSLEVLSIIWNSKEAMFKLCDRTGIDFKDNLNVSKIDFDDKIVEAELSFNEDKIEVKGRLDIFANHTLVFLMIG
ncbi:MAG: 4'-phosphopantetheinyl transferase superfamily protein [Flavobacteriales bacterium]|nr:4'-phosphopantetheinyl transferase superfamily protein [Flavobacteriales bacterium]